MMSNTNRVNSFNDFKNAMPYQINEYFSNKKLEELSIHELVYTYLEQYSRGWRGAPAKGVGRATGARVQIPLSPFTTNRK